MEFVFMAMLRTCATIGMFLYEPRIYQGEYY